MHAQNNPQMEMAQILNTKKIVWSEKLLKYKNPCFIHYEYWLLITADWT